MSPCIKDCLTKCRREFGAATNNPGDFMKVCIFGAGAVGGHIATRLIAAKADDISVVARAAQLQAIPTAGRTLRPGGKEIHAQPALATDHPSTPPPPDVIAAAI